MANRQLLLRAFIRAAKVQAVAASSTPIQVLTNLITGRFSTEATEGKTLISSTENGGTVLFTLPAEFGPADVMALAEEGIEWLENQPDPNNPVLSQRVIKRLRVNFNKAQL